MEHKIYKTSFLSVYKLLVNKVERKNRTKEELNNIIYWLTGYDEITLQQQLNNEVDYETFFDEAPCINENANKITGVVCGIRVEELEDPLMKKIRWLDKMVDELAKGRPMEKILRK